MPRKFSRNELMLAQNFNCCRYLTMIGSLVLFLCIISILWPFYFKPVEGWRLRASGGMIRGSATWLTIEAIDGECLSSRAAVDSKLIKLRGGASSEDDYEEEDDDYDVELDEADFDDEGLDNQEIPQNHLMTSIADMWGKTPPITQVYIGASIGLTIFAFLFNKNVWPEIFNLEWSHLLSLQLWRPLTAFLFFGPLGFNYILTIHFVWTYMAQLEKLNYKHPEEFFVQLVFGGAALMVSYSLLGLSPKFLGHNLSTFLVYIWARVFEGTDVNVMDLFNLKAEYLPWFFCLQTGVLEGEMPFADILGIVVGHLYQYLHGQKMLKAPQSLRDYFSSDQMKRKYAAFKEDFE